MSQRGPFPAFSRLTVLGLSLAAGTLTLLPSLGCSGSSMSGSSKDPAPNISNFSVTPKVVAAGGTAKVNFTANFSGQGVTGLVTPGNLSITPATALGVTQPSTTTTYTLTVTDSAGRTTTTTTQVEVLGTQDTTITTGGDNAGKVTKGTTGLTATVPAGDSRNTFLWTISNGTITGGQGTNAITYTAGTTVGAKVTLNCAITNAARVTSNGTKSLDIVDVAPAGLSYSTNPAGYYANVPITANVPANTGGTVLSYAVDPALPTGLVLNTATGVITGTPAAQTAQATYTITATNSGGAATTGLVITVNPQPAVTFSASATTIAPGGTSILSWTIDSSIASVSITDGTNTYGPYTTSGTKNVSPTANTTYTLQATLKVGGTYTAPAIAVTVDKTPLAISNFQGTNVEFGQTSTLTWTLTGTAATQTLDGTALAFTARSADVQPVRRQTYSLTASNDLTTDTKSTTVAARGLDALAGSAAAGGCVDGTGPNAKFLFATSFTTSATGATMNLTLGGDGNLYVADQANHVVRMVTPAGVVTTLAGMPGVAFNKNTDGDGSGTGSAARFDRPAQVLYIDASTLYVSDSNTHSLRRMDKQADGTWKVSLAAGTPGSYGYANTQGLDSPLSIAAYNGKIYIADMFTSTIRVYDPNAAAGSLLTTLAGGGTDGKSYGFVDATGTAARFRDPSGIVIDPSNGDIYVADRENHAIRKVTQAGVVTTIAGAAGTAASGTTDATGNSARFYRPCAITRDSGGNFYISDYANHRIRKMTPTYAVATIAGSAAGYADGSGTAVAFNGPQGIAVNAAGTLFVADTLNYHIRSLTPNAGSYDSASFAGARFTGLTDGAGSVARFKVPNGIAVDKNGDAYIADEQNKVIRKVSADGTVSTLASGYTFTAPYAITVDDSLNVYVTDKTATTLDVVKIPASGTAVKVALTGAAPALDKANGRGLAVSKDGTAIFIANGNNLQKFDLGTLAQTAVLSGSSVNGIAVASDGIYWADYGTNSIKKASLTLTGTAVLAGGTKGFLDGTGAAAQFNAPVAITLATDTNGAATTVYVVDQANYALRKIDVTTGAVTVLAGKPSLMGAVPGTLGSSGTAGLYWPKGIGLNPKSGDLLVSSSDGILQITAP